MIGNPTLDDFQLAILAQCGLDILFTIYIVVIINKLNKVKK